MSNIFHQMKGTITFKNYFKIHANIEIFLLPPVSEIAYNLHREEIKHTSWRERSLQ